VSVRLTAYVILHVIILPSISWGIDEVFVML
jgi:hypothetical protein